MNRPRKTGDGMSWQISNWRIGTKLGISFLVMVFSALLGLVAWLQLTQIHAASTAVSEVALPSVYNAASMRSEFNRLRRHEAGIATARTLVEIEGYEQQIQQRLKTIGEQEKVMVGLLTGEACALPMPSTRSTRRPFWTCTSNCSAVHAMAATTPWKSRRPWQTRWVCFCR